MDLQTLIDIEAVRRLGHHYANLCDDGFLAEPLADLFTPDGEWTAEGFGIYSGRDALIEFFSGLEAQSLFALHLTGNEEIDIEGDTAKSRWSAINVNTFKGEEAPHDNWIFLRYDNELVRMDGEWKFRRMAVTIKATGSHDSGWAASVDPD